jgi:hypothetical protein
MGNIADAIDADTGLSDVASNDRWINIITNT